MSQATAKQELNKNVFTSIFDKKKGFQVAAEPKFIPPEAFGVSDSNDDAFSDEELKQMNAWDLATRYHEFKSKKTSDKIRKSLRRLSADAVLERAREVLGSVVRPMEPKVAPWPDLPYAAEQIDFDLEETVENTPLGVLGAFQPNSDVYSIRHDEIWMNYSVHRHQPLVLTVDTSLSMTGEKLALTAVALAVVLLEFPDDPIGIIAFENEAKILKKPEERISIQLLVERFLDVPAQGYTHLEDGLRGALKLLRSSGLIGRSSLASTVLLTDGKYTAGKDPAYLAPRFHHLVVLKMGKERASLELCQSLARRGHGALREVPELDALPGVMYGVVKDLLRGRSLA